VGTIEVYGRTSEMRLLLREFAHRVHNEFASAMAAVSLSAARSESSEVKAALGAVREKLYRYAQVHRALEVPADDAVLDASVHLRQLCEAIVCSKLEHQGIALVLAAEPVFLEAERCRRLGMIVAELVHNAARHAFHGRVGTIRVELSPAGSSVECRVSDDGSAPSRVKPGRGLGIIAALTSTIDGEIAQQFGPQGSVSIVRFRALESVAEARAHAS
jgi:two-component sensor histidine kinase